MTTAQLVTVEEYLHTSFEHDAEYVEGKIVDRSSPQVTHSRMQGDLLGALNEEGRSRGYKVWPELRIRTRRDPARFRVPDLCLTLGEPDEQILTSPPFLCVEILSGEIYTADRIEKITNARFTTGELSIDLSAFD